MGVKAQMLLCVRETDKISAAFGAKSHATHEPFKVQSESDRTQMAETNPTDLFSNWDLYSISALIFTVGLLSKFKMIVFPNWL